MSMYQLELLGHQENMVRFRIKQKQTHLSFQQVFELWATDPAFTRFYVEQLLHVDYQAFYWEHPPLNEVYLSKRYECIMIRSKPLEHLPVNETAFQDHLYREEDVTDFMNLGKNARLVIPTKKSAEEIYNHMGKFIRFAEEKQILAVFKRVGNLLPVEIKKRGLIWLNTAGLGVIWLHIRMDTRPKYYKTARYKDPDFLQNDGLVS